MTGWTHEEAKRHTLAERLRERCATYSPTGAPCHLGTLARIDWCERCLAASLLINTGMDGVES